jgi:hypothetical protein
MPIVRIVVAALALVIALRANADAVAAPPGGHYLFAWTGDADKQGNDFLAVIDADPASPHYGRLVTTTVTDQRTVRIHHTEYVMPESGMLFANDHDVGRTFVFDVNDPLHPRVAASFGDLDGYMHPHSFVRLPNGNVLATFQHDHRRLNAERRGRLGRSGGLVEIDDQGRAVRSASSADPAFPDALLMPYGLVVLPGLDRVVSTNSSMHDEDLFSGVTYQVWRLSDLKLLQTAYLDVGEGRYGHVSPEEPRLGPDGAVYVQTLACGLERITVSKTRGATSKLVHTFPGSLCGVPTIVGRYYIQSVPALRGLVVLDISAGARPVEVARIRLSDTFEPHWTGWDPKTQRLVVTGSGSRLYLLKFDPQSGAIAVDEAFRDEQGRPGFDFAARAWPHGWAGTGKPHGVVFSR